MTRKFRVFITILGKGSQSKSDVKMTNILRTHG